MQEVFEKIKERLEERLKFYENRFAEMSGTDRDVEDWGSIKSYKDAIEIVNQVESEYQSTVGQVKCDASFSDGYIKGIDDAIEKFLEYGCFCIEWNPKLSKEKLVDDVMRQVRGQSVYILEKLKQKAEEYNQSLANNNQSLTNGGWIPCSERLPEMFKYVLVWCKGRFVDGTHVGEECKNYGIGIVYNKWKVCQSKDIKDIEVIAWQPLPEPYRGE